MKIHATNRKLFQKLHHYTSTCQYTQVQKLVTFISLFLNLISWNEHIVSWEPEGHYHHRLGSAIAPFWFSTEHLWVMIAPFWLSTDDNEYCSALYPTELVKIIWRVNACSHLWMLLLQLLTLVFIVLLTFVSQLGLFWRICDKLQNKLVTKRLKSFPPWMVHRMAPTSLFQYPYATHLPCSESYSRGSVH